VKSSVMFQIPVDKNPLMLPPYPLYIPLIAELLFIGVHQISSLGASFGRPL